MRYSTWCASLIGFALLLIISAGSAHAQASRTWVSGVGDDANPCSRTAPCKTFAGTISKTAAGGQINCIDPGGFGAVTITKSIAIQCDNTEAGVLVSGTNGIVINAGVNDVVYLSGLDIQGLGTGVNGIFFNAGKALYVKNCVIRGFATNGILFAPSTATASLVVQDTVVADNPSTAPKSGGILISPGAGFNATAALTNVQMVRNVFGVRAEDRSQVTVFHSAAISNTNNGILAVANAAPTEITVVDTVIANSPGNGVATSGATATIRLVNSRIIDNSIGINTTSAGVVQGTSPATNLNAGNATAGAPSVSNNLQ